MYTEFNIRFRGNISSYNTGREKEIVSVLFVRLEYTLKNESKGIPYTGTLLLLVIF